VKTWMTQAVLIVLAMLVGGCASDKTTAQQAGLPQVTVPNGRSPATDNAPRAGANDTAQARGGGWNHGNGILWVGLRGRPYVPDDVEKDGSLRVKAGWWKGYPGKLTVTGRRLDAPAPPLRCSVNTDYKDGDIGPLASYFWFPTEGYWKITGHLNGQDLTFIVQVVNKS